MNNVSRVKIRKIVYKLVPKSYPFLISKNVITAESTTPFIAVIIPFRPDFAKFANCILLITRACPDIAIRMVDGKSNKDVAGPDTVRSKKLKEKQEAVIQRYVQVDLRRSNNQPTGNEQRNKAESHNVYTRLKLPANWK